MGKLFKLFFVIFSVLFFNNANCQEKKFVEINPDSLVSFARKFIGTPYVWAGCSPSGFDCSGFVWYVYNHFGISTTHNSYDFPQFGKEIKLDSCKTGDIILFTREKTKDKKIGHVGIIISNSENKITFIQSSSSKKHNGVVVSELNAAYKKRFVEVIRLKAENL